jgi:hypothetical protein
MRGWALCVAPGEQAARWGQAAGRGSCHAEAPRPRKPRSCLAGASLRRGRAMQAASRPRGRAAPGRARCGQLRQATQGPDCAGEAGARAQVHAPRRAGSRTAPHHGRPRPHHARHATRRARAHHVVPGHHAGQPRAGRAASRQRRAEQHARGARWAGCVAHKAASHAGAPWPDLGKEKKKNGGEGGAAHHDEQRTGGGTSG